MDGTIDGTIDGIETPTGSVQISELLPAQKGMNTVARFFWGELNDGDVDNGLKEDWRAGKAPEMRTELESPGKWPPKYIDCSWEAHFNDEATLIGGIIS